MIVDVKIFFFFFLKVTLYTDTKTQQPMIPIDPQKQRQTLFE